jgi:uncharacterized membrane protein
MPHCRLNINGKSEIAAALSSMKNPRLEATCDGVIAIAVALLHLGPLD